MTEFATSAKTDAVALTDPALFAAHIEYCTLCIEIDTHYFRFCIVENISSQCRWLASYPFPEPLSRSSLLNELRNIIDNHPLLSITTWGNIVVSFHSFAFTYIPAPLFRADHAEEYLKIMLPQVQHPEDEICEDKLRIIDGHAVFTAPSAIINWFTERYPDKTIRFCHYTEPLIYATITDNYQTITGRRVNLLTDHGRATVTVVDGPKFIFCNSFQFTTPQELTYLILFVIKQLDTNPEDIRLIINGDTSAGSPEHTELSRFFPHLEMGKKPQSLSYNPRINDVEGHRYATLLNTYFMVF